MEPDFFAAPGRFVMPGPDDDDDDDEDDNDELRHIYHFGAGTLFRVFNFGREWVVCWVGTFVYYSSY